MTPTQKEYDQLRFIKGVEQLEKDVQNGFHKKDPERPLKPIPLKYKKKSDEQ
jgi:hypothetical protein